MKEQCVLWLISAVSFFTLHWTSFNSNASSAAHAVVNKKKINLLPENNFTEMGKKALHSICNLYDKS